MIPSHEPPIAQNVDSDSDSEDSDDNLDSIIRKNLSNQANGNLNKRILTTKTKVYIALIFVIFAAIATYQIISISTQAQRTRGELAKKAPKISRDPNSPTTLPSPDLEGENIQNIKIKVNAEEKHTIEGLRELNKSEQIKNVNFLSQHVKFGINHWYIKRDVNCIPDHIVNSASKISDSFYIQKTAYQDINRIAYSVTIPARDIYSLEPPRQLMQNMSITYPDEFVAYDHYDPLLLTLVIRYYPKGVFVSKGVDWSLLQQNLLLNDLLPLANFVDRQTLIQGDRYQLLITSNMKEAVQLITKEKRQLTILTNINEPTLIQTAVLMKMKVYKLSEGQECQRRTISLIQQSNWRVDESAFLVMGWYLLTPLSYSINFNNHIFNYQAPLVRQNQIQCYLPQQYIATKQLLINNKIQITHLPFSELYFYSKDRVVPQEYYEGYYRSIFGYINNANLSGPIYLDSGPSYFLLVVVSFLPNKIRIFLNGQYQQKKWLIKNFVLNNQQKVQIISNTEAIKYKYELTITITPGNIAKINSQKYLLLNNNLETAQNAESIFAQFEYTKLISSLCNMPTLQNTNSQLGKGLYLVERK